MSHTTSRKNLLPLLLILTLAAVAVAALMERPAHLASGRNAASMVAAPLAMTGAQQPRQMRSRMAALPLAFEANQGQVDPRVKYMARGNGYTVFLTENETVFALNGSSEPGTAARLLSPSSKVHNTINSQQLDSVLSLRFVGGNQEPSIEARAQLAGVSNYFIGSDSRRWHTNVPQFGRVSYDNVYPGINLVFYGLQTQLEFDFVVAPVADLKTIRFEVSGSTNVKTDEAGNLILASANGDVVLHKPFAYQENNGNRRTVDTRFVLAANRQVGFEVGDYDRSRELVIDPSVAYATYLGGGAEDDGNAIAIDGSGNAYVTGQTKSTNFPTTAGSHSTGNAGSFDAFVTKISADGSQLLYSTYIGGSGDDSGNAIAVDGSGNAFVAGGTASSNFPTSTGAFQKTFASGGLDAFVLELSSNGGSLTYSTYLGGNGSDVANGLALDTSGNTYIVGSTSSTNFPTHLPIQNSLNGASNGFVTKLNSAGNALVYSTYLGGGSGDFASAVALDSSDNAYVTGATQNASFPATAGAFQTTCGTAPNCNGGLSDAFVSVIKADGSGFVYSTFLGGGNVEQGLGIAVDAAKNAHVTGLTQSSDFPKASALQSTFGGVQDAFVTELNSTGGGLLYSTYMGGSLTDAGTSIALDSADDAYITGQTASSNFPMANTTQSTIGGANDAFVSEINAGGTQLLFSTYLGGTLNENTSASGGSLAAMGAIAVDSAGANIYVTGNTASTNFPTQAAKQGTSGGGTDAFVAKYTSSSANFTVADGALSVTSGNPGVSATSTITVTSVNSFSSAVTLACSVSPAVAKGPNCGFSNPGATVTPPANGSVTATLTVSTTSASALMQHSKTFSYAMFLPIGAFALLGTASFGKKRHAALSLLFLIAMLVILMPGCSGGSGGGGGGGGGTPAGNYTITVTGTSGAAVANGSPSLTLTVN